MFTIIKQLNALKYFEHSSAIVHDHNEETSTNTFTIKFNLKLWIMMLNVISGLSHVSSNDNFDKYKYNAIVNGPYVTNESKYVICSNTLSRINKFLFMGLQWRLRLTQWHFHWSQGTSTYVSTWMGDHQRILGTMNLGPFVNVD